MMIQLSAAHRIARTNYAPRVVSFAFIFVVMVLLIGERGGGWWAIALAVLLFIVYPHLAYLHARIAPDSKRAEQLNLLADALLLGIGSAQAGFPLWTSCGLLIGPGLNNAAYGGLPRLGAAVLLYALGALGWGAIAGFAFQPDASALVTGLSLAGIVLYVFGVGLLVHDQHRRIVRADRALASTEEQFRFISERAGDLVSVLDRDGRFRYASPLHIAYAGADAVSPGRPWLDLVHPDDRRLARHFLHTLAANRSGEPARLRMFPVNGVWRTVECQGNPVRDETGNAGMLVLLTRGVGARLRADIAAQLDTPQGN